MPIHDQGYRRYPGRRLPHGRAWWVIARAGIAARLRERRLLALLLVAWMPFLVRAVQLYVSTNFAQASFLAVDAGTFRDFLTQQRAFVFFIAVFFGAGLIADDRRANALQVYLSKPLTRLEYVAGKLATLVLFLVAVTWVPAMLLLMLQILFAGSFAFVRANLFLLPAITVVAAAEVFVAAFTMLALSSLSKSARFAGVMYAGVVFFTDAMSEALRATTGSRAWAWMSPAEVLDIVAAAAFRAGGAPPLPVWAALVVVAALVGASILVLDRRVRAVEVV